MINVLDRLNEARNDETGFTTAELLGNAALGIVALVAIWALMGKLGVSVFNYIEDQLTAKK